MSPTQKHLLHFEGGNALSAFRAQALLPKLQSVSPRITGVAARHVHWVWTDSDAASPTPPASWPACCATATPTPAPPPTPPTPRSWW